MELIDIVDENNELIGIVEERNIAHEKNLWHRHVNSWIMNERGEILLQRRAATKARHPNVWAKTGGHVDSGETPEEAIQREVKEEVGILIPKEQIEIISIRKSKNPDNNFFIYNFIFTVNYKIEEYKLQNEEVSEVKYFTIEEIVQAKKSKNKDFVFSKWYDEDFYEEIDTLKRKRKEILNVQGINSDIHGNEKSIRCGRMWRD